MKQIKETKRQKQKAGTSSLPSWSLTPFPALSSHHETGFGPSTLVYSEGNKGFVMKDLPENYVDRGPDIRERKIMFRKRKDLDSAFQALKFLTTPEEKQAIHAYTENGYEEVNKALREDGIFSKFASDNIILLDNIFSIVPPLKEPLTLYRGMRHFDYSWKHDRSYWSTSMRKSAALLVASAYLLEIEVAQGTHVLPLVGEFGFANENEILLPRNGMVTFLSHRIDTEMQPPIEVIKLRFEQPHIRYINPLRGTSA
jgi:hypothetical protein